MRPLVLLVSVACVVTAQDKKSQLPDGPGKQAFVQICSQCHGAEIVIGRGNTEDGWTQVVLRMIQQGAQGSDDQFGQIVDYLTTNFPPGGAASAQKINVNKAGADQLQSALSLTRKEAAAIISYRDRNGPFKNIAELKKVPDLDSAKIDANKDKLSFE